MSLIDKKNLVVFLILLLSTTVSVSQTVTINTTKETTLLDKGATIAIGNLLREGQALDTLFNKQSILIENLRLESSGYRKEADTLRLGLTDMRLALEETKKDHNYQKKNWSLEKGLLEAEVKTQKSKKWTFGSWGVVLGSVLTTLAFLFI